MKEREILEKHFKIAKEQSSKIIKETTDLIRKDIDVLIDKIESNKSLVSALVTSIIKKITTPEQDIRLHRTDFNGGYSARSLDTQVTAIFFKQHFPKYANKETAFLTLATREKIKWDKRNGKNLKIRNKELKNSYLNIFDNIENKGINPEIYLNYLLTKLIKLTKNNELIFKKVKSRKTGILNINLILQMLTEHFGINLGSRLPVVAIYSIYQNLIPVLKRYERKKLINLQVHTSSDKKGFGDIEIYTLDDKPFEIVEIKHNIPIDKYLIFDIVKKTENIDIDRYYILTTYPKGFENKETEKEIQDFILEVYKNRKLDIIANGILTTLKYYLRFIDDYKQFLKTYTDNLIKEAKNSTEVKNFHIEKWNEIMEKYKL